ncbi:hypothetical protein BS50DRAFT_677181 [Corynespora cassiicola Philippines]|uniref:DUF4604 domain-containing protein n=1 Tax=Corynespora cassiicola Philippines TaxID=1448308 RepID=A0A2T2NLA2_CORCC|nr:hypothetical protein BS50DRAFT_677181 [Corynespora cassiicola Philippines]
MSFKAKDLSYDDTQPAFLRRLRGELAGDGSGRHERPIPRNKRMKQDDEDDAPTYVLEESNESMSKEEYEALMAGKDPKEADSSKAGAGDKAPGPEPKKDNIAEAGKTSKKRKVAKVIGDEQEHDKSEKPEKSDAAPKVIKKAKKKAKPVKLSFGDEEEEG